LETYKGSPIKVNSNLNSESLNIFYKTNELVNPGVGDYSIANI
jgi:hypothetical protein